MMLERLLDSPLALDVAGLELQVLDDNDATRTIESYTRVLDLDVSQVDRLSGHGQFAQQGHRGGQLFTIEGQVFASDRGPVAAAVDALLSVLADGSFGTLTVVDDDFVTKTAIVQLAAPPNIDWVEAAQCRYQLQLHAPDSFMHGATATASTGFAAPAPGAGMVFPLYPDGVMDFGPLGDVGTLSLANAGTAPAPVVFTITGPAPEGGFSIVDLSTGKRITFLGSLPAGSSLVMDGSDGSVVINGTADRLGDTVVEAWPQIPKASESTFSFEPIGAATTAILSAACTATYW